MNDKTEMTKSDNKDARIHTAKWHDKSNGDVWLA